MVVTGESERSTGMSEGQSLSCVQLCDFTDAPSMEFSRQEYWSVLLFPSLKDLPDPGIKPRSPALQADSLPSEPPGKPHYWHNRC